MVLGHGIIVLVHPQLIFRSTRSASAGPLRRPGPRSLQTVADGSPEDAQTCCAEGKPDATIPWHMMTEAPRRLEDWRPAITAEYHVPRRTSTRSACGPPPKETRRPVPLFRTAIHPFVPPNSLGTGVGTCGAARRARITSFTANAPGPRPAWPSAASILRRSPPSHSRRRGPRVASAKSPSARPRRQAVGAFIRSYTSLGRA